MKAKFNIFWKTFIMITAMLMGVTFVVLMLIYMLLPGFYQNHKITTYNELVNNRLIELENTQDLVDEITILNDIFQDSNTPFRVHDDEGAILHQIELFNQVNIRQSVEFEEIDVQYDILVQHEPAIWYSEISEISNEVHFIEVGSASILSGFSVRAFDFEDTFLNLNFDYTTSLGHNRTLTVSVPLTALADSQIVIMSMYPFAVLLSVLFALITAFIFSRWIANPIKKIQAATSRMRKLEPNIAIMTKSQDEIGILSHDISQLYEQLRSTIVTLEQEISRYSDAENKKIEFLQSVSHEMKTPLASANALLEGIIYEVSPYHDKPKQYLEECRGFLQKTIQLTKESLNLSEQYKKTEAVYNLADIVKETSNLYGVIFMVKQLSYHEDIPENINILTKKNLLLKVLSNLFSNAANYTSDGGQVRISFNNDILTIFNSCTPLSQEQIEEIFKPLMMQNTAKDATGLGLFIVKQLLRQLKIKFTFTPSESGDGMEFKLWISKVMDN